MKTTVYKCFALCLIFSFSSYAQKNTISAGGQYSPQLTKLPSPKQPVKVGIAPATINFFVQ